MFVQRAPAVVVPMGAILLVATVILGVVEAQTGREEAIATGVAGTLTARAATAAAHDAIVEAQVAATLTAWPTHAWPSPTPTDEPSVAATKEAPAISTEVAATVAAARRLVPGSPWTRAADSMVMVYVPGGSFRMGNEEGTSDERPLHYVTLGAFWMDRTEVTNAQYGLCVAAKACSPSRLAGNSRFNGGDQPVVGVSWIDSDQYCKWAGMRLPTEAEWEYSARGPEGNVYPWGNEFNSANLNADFSDQAKTMPVGSYPGGASWCGALDLAGNVEELVADWYHDQYYSLSPERNPSGPESGVCRVVRGGASDKAADRDCQQPRDVDTHLGFRCAMTSDQNES